MPPAPVSESTAPSWIVLPALLPALGDDVVPVDVLLLQADSTRAEAATTDAACRPRRRTPPFVRNRKPPRARWRSMARIVETSPRGSPDVVLGTAPCDARQASGVRAAPAGGRRLGAPALAHWRLRARRAGRGLPGDHAPPALHRVAQVCGVGCSHGEGVLVGLGGGCRRWRREGRCGWGAGRTRRVPPDHAAERARRGCPLGQDRFHGVRRHLAPELALQAGQPVGDLSDALAKGHEFVVGHGVHPGVVRADGELLQLFHLLQQPVKVAHRPSTLQPTLRDPARTPKRRIAPHLVQAGGSFSRTYRPMTRASSPVEKKVRRASPGEQTMGSPWSLKDVFSTIGTPVSWWNASINRRNGGLAASVTVCRRPVPSTCVIAGTWLRRSGRMGRQSSMNGDGATGSNQFGASSASTEGAKGRNGSRCFTSALMVSFMWSGRGSARIDRFPSAQGPASALPWNQPVMLPAASRRAASREGSGTSR